MTPSWCYRYRACHVVVAVHEKIVNGSCNSGIMDILKQFHLQKFNGKNFQLWKYQLEIIFRAEAGMENLVNGKTACPAATDAAGRTAWDTLNAKAMLLISSGMELEQLQTVITCETAAAMWARLKAIHEQRSSVNKVALKQQFFSYNMSETDSIAQHISKVEELAQALAGVGEPVKDVDKMAKLLGGLPYKYNAFVTAWDSYDESKQTFDNLTARLLKEEQRLTQTEDMATAFAAVNIKGKQSKSASATSKKSDKKNESHNKRHIECFYCKKKGHYKSECRARLAKQKQASDERNVVAMCVEMKNLSQTNSEDEWLADSGASKHMSHRREWFTVLDKSAGDSFVQIGDNSRLRVEGRGSICVQALVNGKWEPRTLVDVLFVPELKKNLMSIGALTSKNFKAVFDSDKLEIHASQVIAVGVRKKNQCYKMIFKTEINQEVANVTVGDSAKLWHERMGHISFHTLKEMADSGLIPGLKINNLDGLFCEMCQFGKLHRRPFKTNLQERAAKPGDSIHMDLCGKMTHSSVSGANYFLLFKDDCTSYRTVYFIKHKSDAYAKFVEYKQLVETQTSNKIKRVRSDNGLEFRNEQFLQLFKGSGVIPEFTAPYTAEQNGRIERENRSIVESARTMLIAANLQPELWAEAVNTSVYILNRKPRSLDKKIPYELWSGKKVNLNHMRKFGSEGYVHVPKQFRTKFNTKAKKMILVGYENDSVNYRLVNVNTGKIVITRDVNFNEETQCNEVQNNNVKDTFLVCFKDEVLQPEQQQDEHDDVEIIEDAAADQNNGENEINPVAGERQLRDRNTIRQPLRYIEYTDEYADDEVDIACSAIFNEEPQTFDEAMTRDDAKQWQQAMKEEIESLKSNNTWTLQPLPENRRSIDCKWVYKIKRGIDGSVERYKARLCAKGFTQKKGIDYTETFSPVVRYDSVRFLLSLATVNDWEIHQFDVKTAFLHGDLDEDLFMKQPEGFISKNPEYVCKLNKSLYGLKQAPRCWNKKFEKVLSNFNFIQLESDRSVYKAVYDEVVVYLALYVDDGLIMSENGNVIKKILTELGSMVEITVSNPEVYVGLEIIRNRKEKTMFINQKSYISRVLEKFNMSNCRSNAVPADPKALTSLQDIQSNDGEEMKIPYREAVGSLMFAAVVSRPDIMYAVGQVSRHLNNPDRSHWIAVKRILRYLQGSRDVGIMYSGSSEELKVYSDADFAGDPDTRKSTSGYVSVFANGPVTWCSQRQKCVARSTTEAEYVAASNAAQETMWLRAFLNETEGGATLPTKLLIDNQSALNLVKNSDHHKLTKHIDVKYHYIRQQVQNEEIETVYVPSNEQLADFLTKPLSREKFSVNCKKLSICSGTNYVKSA